MTASDNPQQLSKELVAERRRPGFGFCAYCGHPCAGYACRAHSDLPAREQFDLRSPRSGHDSKEGTTP